MRSDRQEAVDFQNWVCDEVLPSIREHGLYATNEKLERIITSPEFGIRLLSELKDEREARMRESALRNQTV
jgi:anti-repressor protein